ncbi:MAG TPA: hypothetical protein VLK84_10725 [Longimicrobium sp.]|nr:hypothetical protein [Longimicrobium sp.]
MTIPRAYGARTALLALLAAAACTDRSPTGPAAGGATPGGEPGGPTATIAELTCTADRQAGTVSCVPAAPDVGEASGLILGNQGIYVQLTSTNVNYNSGTGQFTFDATLQNLIEQPLGTTDGTTLDPAGIRIYFHEVPTVVEGSGIASVVPDGFAFFTAAAQPYYNYPYLLEQSDVSPAETWTFVVPPTATRFIFSVFVSAPVQYPTGYITLNGELPGASYGPLHPATPTALTAVVKNAVGAVVPGVVTFGTTDPLCAQVTGTGTVSGIRAATCSITATSGAFAGEMVFDVTGAGRVWNGSVSADWSAGANWDGGYAPAAVDSAIIPAGVPNFPALVAATSIGGVTVADGATLLLGAFDLTASANVLTGYTVGSGIVGTTGVLQLAGTSEVVRGRVPSLLVTGTYTLSGDLHVVAPGRIVSGRVRNVGHLLRLVAQ